jgi:hypothetical protein
MLRTNRFQVLAMTEDLYEDFEDIAEERAEMEVEKNAAIDIEMVGDMLCVRKDGTLVEIIDSVCFFRIMENNYVYIEYMPDSTPLSELDPVNGRNSIDSIVCKLFSINDYISTGIVKLMTIFEYYKSNKDLLVPVKGFFCKS